MKSNRLFLNEITETDILGSALLTLSLTLTLISQESFPVLVTIPVSDKIDYVNQ